jgi:hypothetical protein
MTRIGFLAVASALWIGSADACTPHAWVTGRHARSSAEFAADLVKHATALVRARVISAETVDPLSRPADVRAEIVVLEHFKGPNDLRVVFNSAVCPNPRAFVSGEERLFILVASPHSEASARYYEPLGAGLSQFSEADVLEHLREITKSNPRLHRTLNQRRFACWSRAGEADR